MKTKLLAVFLALTMLLGVAPLSVLAYWEEPSAEGNDDLEAIVNDYTKPVGITMQRLTGSCVSEVDNLGDDFLFVIKKDGRYYAMKDVAASETAYDSIPAVDVTAWVNADGSLTVPADTLGVAFMRYEERYDHELGMFINGREDYLTYTYTYESADGDDDQYNDAERTYSAAFKIRTFESGQYIFNPGYWSENDVSGTLNFSGRWSYYPSSYNSVSKYYELIADLRSDGTGGQEFYFRYLGTDVEYVGDEVEGYLYYTDCRHQGTVRHAEYDAPTCMLKGCEEYWYCEWCDEYYADAAMTELFGEEMPVIPATGHAWGTERCENCSRPLPVYSKVTNQAQFDALADDTMFVLVAEYGGKHYVMDFSEVYSYMTDSDGDGFYDIHNVDADEDGIPDYLEFDEGGGGEWGDEPNGVYDYLEWDMDNDGNVDETDLLEFHYMTCDAVLTDMLYNNGSINATEITVAPDGTISHEEAKKTAEFEMVDVYDDTMYNPDWHSYWENGVMPYHTACVKQFVIPNYFLSAPSMRPIERMYRQHIYDFGDSSSWGVIFYDSRADYYSYTDGDMDEKLDADEDGTPDPLPFLDINQAGSVAVFDTFDDIGWILYHEGQLAQLRLRDYNEQIGFVTGHDYELDGWEWVDDGDEGYYDTHDVQACVYLYASAPYEAPHVCEFGDWMPDPNNDMKHIRSCECGESESGDHAFGDFAKKDDAYHTHTCPTCGAIEDFEHSFNDWIAQDNTNHIHACMECEHTSVLPHDYVREIAVEPTVAEVGEATYTCSLCSHSYTEELPRRIEQVTGGVVGTVLNVPAGSNAYIPEGTVFEVVEEPVEQVPEQVLGEIAVTAEGAPKALGMYDLSLLLEGATIQPNGTVAITIPAPDLAAEYEHIMVVYIAPDGSYEECKSTINEDGTITFETDHFSQYAVIGIGEGGLGAGAIVGIVLGALALLGGGGFCLYWFVFRKKKTALTKA